MKLNKEDCQLKYRGSLLKDKKYLIIELYLNEKKMNNF